MKAHMMFKDRDFDTEAPPCFGKDTLRTDLGLDSIISAMADGDGILEDSCTAALFCPLDQQTK